MRTKPESTLSLALNTHRAYDYLSEWRLRTHSVCEECAPRHTRTSRRRERASSNILEGPREFLRSVLEDPVLRRGRLWNACGASAGNLGPPNASWWPRAVQRVNEKRRDVKSETTLADAALRAQAVRRRGLAGKPRVNTQEGDRNQWELQDKQRTVTIHFDCIGERKGQVRRGSRSRVFRKCGRDNC